MDDAIAKSKFDYLFIQFYNSPYCSAYQLVRPDGGSRVRRASGMNLEDWQTFASQGKSAGAKLFVGLPASGAASTGEDSGAKFYLTPDELVTAAEQMKKMDGFSGIRLWDAGNSDGNVEGGCTYAQQVSSVLEKGVACVEGV